MGEGLRGALRVRVADSEYTRQSLARTLPDVFAADPSWCTPWIGQLAQNGRLVAVVDARAGVIALGYPVRFHDMGVSQTLTGPLDHPTRRRSLWSPLGAHRVVIALPFCRFIRKGDQNTNRVGCDVIPNQGNHLIFDDHSLYDWTGRLELHDQMGLLYSMVFLNPSTSRWSTSRARSASRFSFYSSCTSQRKRSFSSRCHHLFCAAHPRSLRQTETWAPCSTPTRSKR